MKKFLFVLTAMFLASSARAQMTWTQAVRTVVPNSIQCSSQTIGTTAVELTGNTTLPNTSAQVYRIEIANTSSTNTFCSHSSGVTSSGSTIGWMIPFFTGTGAWPSKEFTISPLEKWFCIGGAAGTGIIVCKSK